MSILEVNSLFLLELALGCLLLLPFFSSREITRGFFALHGGIAVIALGLAWLLDRRGAILPEPRLLVALMALALAGTVLSGAGKRVASHLVFWIAGALAAVAIAAAHGPAQQGALLKIGFVLGALVIASTTLTMNLGHWYLVTKELSHRHLTLWSGVYLGSSLLRGVFFFAVTAGIFAGKFGFEAREQLFSFSGDLFFLATRFLWGIAGTVVLSFFVLKTARMRSNQAATGLLYVALVFALVGELLAAYLTIRTRLPL